MKKVFSALKKSFSLSQPEKRADFAMPAPPPPPKPTMPAPPPPPQATLAATGNPDLDRIEQTTKDRVEAMSEKAEKGDAERLAEIQARNDAAIEDIGKEKERIAESPESVKEQWGTPEDVASAQKSADAAVSELEDLENNPLVLDEEANKDAVPPPLENSSAADTAAASEEFAQG